MLSSKLMKIYMVFFGTLIYINVNATVIYDNLSDITTGGSTPQVGLFLANSFSIGPGDQFLTDVKVLVEGGISDIGSFSVSLLSDNNLTPGTVQTVLATVNASQLSSSYNVLDLAVNNINLTGNTFYWIELTSTDANNVQWAWAHISAGDVGVSNVYVWQNGVALTNSDLLYPFQMQITSVPLPNCFNLMGLVLAVFGICRLKSGLSPKYSDVSVKEYKCFLWLSSQCLL